MRKYKGQKVTRFTKEKEDKIIELWNIPSNTVKAIAGKVGESIKETKVVIGRLQRHGIIGKRILHKGAGSKKDGTGTTGRETTLTELMKGVEKATTSDGDISVHHKEMLIEILHRVLK